MFALQFARFRSNKASYQSLLSSMLQIWNHIYSRQLLIIICVGREPYDDCELFVMLLTEMLHHLVRVLAFMLLCCIECSANIFLS